MIGTIQCTCLSAVHPYQKKLMGMNGAKKRQGYGWSLELTGLAYLGIGIGFCAGNFTVAKISDPRRS
jgi:hypothetical protein